MSTSYTTEPPTKGKVICLTICQSASLCCPAGLLLSTNPHAHHLLLQVVLHTTFGPLDIELWPKEAPMVRTAMQAAASRIFFCNRASGLAERVRQMSERLIAACRLHLGTHGTVCGFQAIQPPARSDVCIAPAGHTQLRAAVCGGILRRHSLLPHGQGCLCAGKLIPLQAWSHASGCPTRSFAPLWT